MIIFAVWYWGDTMCNSRDSFGWMEVGLMVMQLMVEMGLIRVYLNWHRKEMFSCLPEAQEKVSKSGSLDNC